MYFYDWYMADVWLIYDWDMTDIWLIYGWYITGADADSDADTAFNKLIIVVAASNQHKLMSNDR